MSADSAHDEKIRAVECLKSGGRIYVVEDKPYPYPHKTLLVLGDESQEISYNTFAVLLSRGALIAKGSAFLEGRYAEVFICSGTNDEITEN